MMRDGGSSSCPFTVSQWQELEHQALIYKYMASGTPIPHDLILPIRNFFYLEPPSASATQLFPPQPTIGWGCYQMGFGRKAEDPEPGRCRRTDGKKWRCSKEAHPDSKYCEKHMHRGKNRSRKPVETPIATNSTVSSATTFTNTSLLYPPRIAVSAAMATEARNHIFPFSAAAEHSVMSFTPQVGDHQISRDAAPSSADRDYRYCSGAKAGANDHTFPEATGVDRDGPWRKGGCFMVADPPSQEEDGKHPHCFVLGTDFQMERVAKAERKEGPQRRPLRFSGGWPPKAEKPWMDDEEEEEEKPRWGAFPGTQLSISIPMTRQPPEG